ncbi:STAS domain-containing protein [Streptomyces sp. NPDC085931]|uniref:STAS domain-containing protein n=1 Tax=Streptomyces sp. NPDC085931 TaxID=3365740 RepID=UPI0037D50E0B
MTNLPSIPFTVTTDREPPTLTVRVAGELDFDTCGEFVDAVVGALSGATGLRDVRLDFRDLAWIDSSGLSALLMIHRHTRAAGTILHLDHRPGFLDRVLELTDVLEHLTAPAARADTGERDDDVTEAGAT